MFESACFLFPGWIFFCGFDCQTFTVPLNVNVMLLYLGAIWDVVLHRL